MGSYPWPGRMPNCNTCRHAHRNDCSGATRMSECNQCTLNSPSTLDGVPAQGIQCSTIPRHAPHLVRSMAQRKAHGSGRCSAPHDVWCSSTPRPCVYVFRTGHVPVNRRTKSAAPESIACRADDDIFANHSVPGEGRAPQMNRRSGHAHQLAVTPSDGR